jgi:hypothetical protein
MTDNEPSILDLPIEKNPQVLYIGDDKFHPESIYGAQLELRCDIQQSHNIDIGSYCKGDYVAAFLPHAYLCCTLASNNLSMLLALSNVQLVGSDHCEDMDYFQAGKIFEGPQTHQFNPFPPINTIFSRPIPFIKINWGFPPDVSLAEVIANKYAFDVEMKKISPEQAVHAINELEAKILSLELPWV